MEQYDKLFPSAYVHSSPPLLVPSGAAQGGEAESAAQEAAGREVWHCGGDGGSELDGGGDPKKRRLSDEQVEMLELSFREERKLETGRKVHLAADLGLDPKQVAVWFQNRRVRHKSKLLEEEFAKLKQAHDAAILQQCHLENEVIRLKKKLEVTEDELARLRSAAGSHAVSGDGGDAMGRVVCSGSPSSSFSTGGTCQQPGVGGGDHLGDDELLYVPDNAYADNSVVEWFSLCGLM